MDSILERSFSARYPPLEPEVVKALIASESSFNTNANNYLKGPKRARGLMQVLDGTLPYLKEEHNIDGIIRS